MKEKIILKYVREYLFYTYQCWYMRGKFRLVKHFIRGPTNTPVFRGLHTKLISLAKGCFYEYGKQIFCIFFVFLFLTNCTCSGGRNRTDFELFHDMIKQENIKAQEGDKEGTFMRIPPENTLARNKEYYPYKGQPEVADQKLKNPFFNQFSADLIGIGKRQYERACIYCHGATGGGEGKVAEKMTVKPPSLLVDKAINYSDGRLYHIIIDGQGVMGSYYKQVRGEKERWALVNYVRMLQKRGLSNGNIIAPTETADPKKSTEPEKKTESEEEGTELEKKTESEEEGTEPEKKIESEEEGTEPEKKTESEEEGTEPEKEVKPGATKLKVHKKYYS